MTMQILLLQMLLAKLIAIALQTGYVMGDLLLLN